MPPAPGQNFGPYEILGPLGDNPRRLARLEREAPLHSLRLLFIQGTPLDSSRLGTLTLVENWFAEFRGR